MPETRRFLTATWRHLAMINYAVEPEMLAPLVPAGTTLDFWHGQTFLSIVGFTFLDTRVRGVAIPFHRDFEEINLRFYLRRDVAGEVRRGVAFIQEIVPRHAIAAVARVLYNENYVAHHTRSIHTFDERGGGWVEYSWHDDRHIHRLRVDVEGSPRLPDPDSEEEFIAEHYWGYSSQRDGSVMEYRVEHEPWRIRPARNTLVEIDVEACYGAAYASALSRPPTSAFVAEGSSVVVHEGRRVDQ